MERRKKFGEILLEKTLLSKAQVDQVLVKQKKDGGKFGAICLSLDYINEIECAETLASQLSLPFIDLQHFEFNPDITLKLSELYARRYKAMLLSESGSETLLAMSDPLDLFAYDEISRKVKLHLQLAVVVESHLMDAIDMVYRHREEISGFAEELSEEMEAREIDIADLDVDTGADDAPVVKLLQSLFDDAVQMGASDIHIEPDEDILRIRQRIDGELQETIMDEKRIIHALTLRLKLMAGLNIAERRMPQDGRFNILVRNQNIDVRLSTMPIQHGEAVVMRLLNQTKGLLDLEGLGVVAPMQKRLRRLVKRPYGMILVTGPTGSGKTTTLYSILNEINQPEKKIITVEDPVEYHLGRVNQVQINERIHLSFSKVLHYALRHDPDIIMIGEIRDNETASIALRAAMTGHLVLATLHTNDAASSALRLISMGVEGFLVATALTAILAQRLVKRVCEKCEISYEPTEKEAAWLKPALGDTYASCRFKVGQGCSHCNHTGYRGRIGVFELLELDKDMVKALHDNDPKAYYKAVEQNTEYRSLGSTALDLAVQGITTVYEVSRVAALITDELSVGIAKVHPQL